MLASDTLSPKMPKIFFSQKRFKKENEVLNIQQSFKRLD